MQDYGTVLPRYHTIPQEHLPLTIIVSRDELITAWASPTTMEPDQLAKHLYELADSLVDRQEPRTRSTSHTSGTSGT